MNYQPYEKQDLDLIINEPWEISDRPYMLHAAYAISSLKDLLQVADEDGEETPIWGMKAPKKTIERLSKDLKMDFNDAADNRKQIVIYGRPYSIRKINAYDHNRLHLIFNFPVDGDDCIVTKEGILNLAGAMPDSLERYECKKDESKANRTYLRQIITLGENDDVNGWDQLTDMEIVAYCWGRYYAKYQDDNLKLFLKKYKSYICVSESDIKRCFIERAQLRDRPIGLYTFSQQKIKHWNEQNNQPSMAERVPPQEAEDYWYEVAVKGRFKPKTD